MKLVDAFDVILMFRKFALRARALRGHADSCREPACARSLSRAAPAHDVDSDRIVAAIWASTHTSAKVSNSSRVRCLQHPIVQIQIGDNPLQLAIRLCKMLRPLRLRETDTMLCMLPQVKPRLDSTRLATIFSDSVSQLALLPRVSDLYSA
ncbi:MAG: hypothetical protein EAZ24_05820 [Burkholderiales bacterium]|nr:MAG: hypothetical protein EAZ24_05820 [Burkholderiales bacterium]